MKLMYKICFIICCPIWGSDTWTLVDRMWWKWPWAVISTLLKVGKDSGTAIALWRWITYNISSGVTCFSGFFC